MAEFKDRFQALVDESNKTATELSRDLNVSKQTISAWCTGARSPRRPLIEHVARHFRVSIPWLMGITDNRRDGQERQPVGDFRPAAPARQVPVLGTIPCGEPTEAVQLSGETAPAPGEITCDYVFRAVGDSMIGAGIHDGDLVYIREQPEVENGQIAAVQLVVDGEYTSTLKRFYRAGDQVILQPENPAFPPQVYTREKISEVRIVGLAVYVLTNLS